MSKNPGSKREIIELPEVPRSSTPEPVPKRPRTSRSTSKLPVRDSRRSDESRARGTKGVIASAAETSEPRGSSMGKPAQTPAVERSSEEETVTEGLLPAVERSSEEETATVVGTRGLELRTPAVERSSGEETVTEGLLPTVERSWVEETATAHDDDGQDPRDQRTPASDGRLGTVLRTTVVERSSGEETVTSSMRVGLRPSVEAEPATSSMLPVERPSGEVHATDVASGSHSAIGTHPPVDRASTDVLETDDALTEPRHASRTPSAYRASTETDTEVLVPVMNTMAGGPSVDRTLTRGVETLALTSAHVAEEPRGDPILVESFTPRFGAATQDSKVETQSEGQGRPPIRWGQGIQIRPSMYRPRPFKSGPIPAAPVDDASRLIIIQSSVSDAITRLQKIALLSSPNHLMRLGSLFSYKDMIAAANKYMLT